MNTTIKTQAFLQGYLHEKTAATTTTGPTTTTTPTAYGGREVVVGGVRYLFPDDSSDGKITTTTTTPTTVTPVPFTSEQVDALSFKNKEDAFKADDAYAAYAQSQRDAELGAPWGEPAYSPYLKRQLGKPPTYSQSGILSRGPAEKIRLLRSGLPGYLGTTSITPPSDLLRPKQAPLITVSTDPRFKDFEQDTIAHEAEHVREQGDSQVSRVLKNLQYGLNSWHNLRSPKTHRKARELNWSPEYTAYWDLPSERRARATQQAWSRGKNRPVTPYIPPAPDDFDGGYDALSDTQDPQWYKDMYRTQGKIQAELELAKRNRFKQWIDARDQVRYPYTIESP